MKYEALKNKDIHFFLFLFFLYKIRKQEGRTGPALGIGTDGSGRRWGKGV
jgi:hypothetical protein